MLLRKLQDYLDKGNYVTRSIKAFLFGGSLYALGELLYYSLGFYTDSERLEARVISALLIIAVFSLWSTRNKRGQ
jgi:hypothetical protein